MTREELVGLIESCIKEHNVDRLKSKLNARGETPLHIACRLKDEELIRRIEDEELIRRIIKELGPDEARQAVLKTDNTGWWTPLHLTVQHGTLGDVEALLEVSELDEARRVIVSFDTEEWTLLHLAARYDSQAVPKLLEVLGPVEARRVAALFNVHRCTPLCYAVRFSPSAVSKLLARVY